MRLQIPHQHDEVDSSVFFYYRLNSASAPQLLGDGCSTVSSATRRFLPVRPHGSKTRVINIASEQKIDVLAATQLYILTLVTKMV